VTFAVLRYRRVSTPAQRQQTKLVVFGFAVAPTGFILNLTLGLFVSPRYAALYTLMVMHLELILLVLIPLTIAFSILRYRLWDIDLIINRTLVYGALTAMIVGVYVLAVGTLGALFQAGGNFFLSILVTGVIAILFHPLRQGLQRGVNRLMYGERDDPVMVLTRLGQRLEAAMTPEAVLPTICETVAQALKLPYVTIALREAEEFQVVAEYRAPLANSLTQGGRREVIPLVYQSETIGQLIVAPRSPDEALTPADRRLLEGIAHQAGACAHAVRLTAALQHSRERLVTAREEERRRLRRDLHDGLGPTLASQTFKLDAALDLLETDPVAVRRLLAELKAQTQATVADIRRLVYELRPPALDELGLISAIGEQAARYGASNHLRVVVEAPPWACRRSRPRSRWPPTASRWRRSPTLPAMPMPGSAWCACRSVTTIC